MAAALGRGDKARLGSRSASPATNSELIDYIQKSNRTIKLLQDELHSASQVAIRLSHKYEAKRAERDEIAGHLSAVVKQNEKHQDQLQLLCDFVTQHCKQQEVPNAVASVLAEHRKANTATSKYPDQQPETAAGGGEAGGRAAEQPDTARRSPRVTLGGVPAIAAAPLPAAAATTGKQGVPLEHAAADARHTSAASTAAGSSPAGLVPVARAKGKPPLSAAVTQRPAVGAAVSTPPKSPAAMTHSKPGSVLDPSSTSSKGSQQPAAAGNQRDSTASRAGLAALVGTASAERGSLTSPASAASRGGATGPSASGAVSPRFSPKTQEEARSSDHGSATAAAPAFSFGSSTRWPPTVAVTAAVGSKQATSSPQEQHPERQASKPSSPLNSPGKASRTNSSQLSPTSSSPQHQQQQPSDHQQQQQQPSYHQQQQQHKEGGPLNSPGKPRTHSSQISPTSSSPQQQQLQHSHQQYQQQRKASSPLNSPGKGEGCSGGRLSPVSGSGTQPFSTDAPMPTARSLAHDSSPTAKGSLHPGRADVVDAAVSEQTRMPAAVTGLANEAQLASPSQRSTIDKANLESEGSGFSDNTSNSGSSVNDSNGDEYGSGNSSSAEDDDDRHSSVKGQHNLMAAAAGSPGARGAPGTGFGSDFVTADTGTESSRQTSARPEPAATVGESLISPKKESSKPSEGSRDESSSEGSESDGEDDGSGSMSAASESSEEDYAESPSAGAAALAHGTAPSRQRDRISVQLPSTLDTDSEDDSGGSSSTSNGGVANEHEPDEFRHDGGSPGNFSDSGSSNADNSSEGEQEESWNDQLTSQQGPLSPGSIQVQHLPQAASPSRSSSSCHGSPVAPPRSAPHSPVFTPTANRDTSSVTAASPSSPMEPIPAASPLQDQQLSMRSSSSFHSATASPRSRRSSYSGSLYSACSRSTRVSQSSLGLTASLVEPDNFGLLLEQTSSGYSQYRISADGANSQRLKQQEGSVGLTEWPNIKQGAVPENIVAAAVGSHQRAVRPFASTTAGAEQPTVAAAVATAASAAAAAAAVSATAAAEASSESSRSDGGLSSGYSSNFATARSRGTSGGAAGGPATHTAAAHVLTGHDSAFGSFVSEGGSIFGFVGDAFNSLQHAVSTAGSVRAAAAAVMGAMPAATHRGATDGGSNASSSRGSWLQSPGGQRSILAHATQPPHQQQGVAQQQQQWQAGAVLGAGSFGGFPPASSSDRSSAGGDDDGASAGGSTRRRSRGGRVPVLTRYFASRARGLSEDEAKQQAEELQQDQPGTSADEQEQPGTTSLVHDDSQRFSSSGGASSDNRTIDSHDSSASGRQPQLQAAAASADLVVEPLGGQAITAQRNLQLPAPLDSSNSGGSWGSLFGGIASFGAALSSPQSPASTSLPGRRAGHRVVAPRTAGGGAPPASTVFGAGSGQPVGFGSQPQPFVFGTPSQQQPQPQAAATQAAPFAFGAAQTPTQQQQPQPVSFSAPGFVFGGASVKQREQQQPPVTAALPARQASSSSSRASNSDGEEPVDGDCSDSEQSPRSKTSTGRGNTFALLAGDSDTDDSAGDSDDGSSW